MSSQLKIMDVDISEGAVRESSVCGYLKIGDWGSEMGEMGDGN